MSTWVDVGTVAEVRRKRKVVVPLGEPEDAGGVGVPAPSVLVLVNGDTFSAFDNVCVHRRKLLERGVILNGRLVCPGHQWAFDLDDGWEAKMERCQPMYDVRVRAGEAGDVVQVDLASVRLRHPEP